MSKESDRREELLEKYKGREDKSLREDQGRLVSEMRSLTDEIEQREGDTRGHMTGDEKVKWEQLNDEFSGLDQELAYRSDEREAQAGRESREQHLAELERRMSESAGRKTDPAAATSPRRNENRGGGELHVADRLSDMDKETRETRGSFWLKYLEGRIGDITPVETRALQADLSTTGGTLVGDAAFFNEIIMFARDMHVVRPMARVIPMPPGYNAIDVPSWDTDAQNFSWGSEIGSYAEDSTITTGKRRLQPNPATLLVKVSKTLARNPLQDVESLVAESIAYEQAETADVAFLTGSGQNQPLGLFTASSDGISTSADVSTGNTTTAITADGLIECKYSLKERYMNAGSWIFSRTAVKNIRKLKDGMGQYLWRLEGFERDRGPVILDSPYRISENAPATFTSGLYVGLFGDFRYYWIAERMPFELETLRELYAATNQLGLIARMEIDGMPVLEEAFVRVTLSS